MDVQIDKILFSDDSVSRLPFGSIFSNNEFLSTQSTRKEPLLRNIDLHLQPGDVHCVFGDNPLSLYALIQIAALRQTKGYLEGSIYFDTLSRHSGLYRDIAYIPTQDSSFHFDRLRVFEVH